MPQSEAELAAFRDAALANAVVAGSLVSEDAQTAALVVGEGLTQAEAGAALGVSEGAIAWRMTEIRKALTALAETEAKA